MTVRLNENHFSHTSSASRVLVRALKEKQCDQVARVITRQWVVYVNGLEQLLVLKNPMRDECLQFWYDKHRQLALDKKFSFDKFGIPFNEYENLLIHRLRKARETGVILEKMRE